MNMKLPILLSVGALVALGGYFYVQPSVVVNTELDARSSSASSSYSAETYSVDELSKMTPETLIDMQEQSLNAVVMAAANVVEFDHVDERPEFISPAEWLMLKSVADQKQDPEAELTRLVNLIRFNKQIELLNKTSAEDDRRVLTEAILSQLPKRIENKEMSVERAQSIQLDVIENLYSDPQDVRDRAAKEAERIGAIFSIEQS